MKIKYLIDTLLSNDIKALDFVGRYGGMVSTIYTSQYDQESKKDVKKRFPVACDVNDIDCNNLALYQDLVPNDDKISVSYWEEISTMANVGETATKNYYQRRFRGSARFVFWANLAKLGSSTCNGDLMAMQLEIERVVTRKGKIVGGLYNDSFVRFQVSKDVPQDINTVFGKYDYPNTLNYYLYPFGFFAVDVEFEIDYCIATGANVPVNPSIDCYNDNGLTDCEKILALLTPELTRTCVQPTIDYSVQANLDALSPTQVSDLQTAFCTPCPPVPSSCPEILAFIAPVRNSCVIPSLVFTAGNDADFNALDGTQTNDLSMRLCGVQDVAASMIFDGVNDKIFAPNKADYDFDGSTPFSFALWAKPTSYAGLMGFFSKRINLGAGYSLNFTAGFVAVTLVNTEVSNQILKSFSTATLTANVWYRFLVTYDGSKTAAGVNLYVDGVLQSFTAPVYDTLTGSISSGALMAIGRNSATGSRWYSGKIEDVTIWNIELDQTQATADAANATTTPVELANVVFNMPGGQGAKWAYTGVWVMDEIMGFNSVGFPTSSLMTFEAWDSADVPN